MDCIQSKFENIIMELVNDLDHLIIDLESSDSNSVALVLRAIYHGDEHEKFMKKLEARIKNHDKDIERMCSDNYQGFTDCIHELLQVRPKAESLKRETMDINFELMRSTDIIQRKAEDLIKSRRILVNSRASIELLQNCLPVLNQYSKLNTQLKEQRYYTALKTLESLENDHLPTVANYRFAQGISKEIPQFRELIKEKSTTDLKDFLANILHASQRIGEDDLKKSAKLQNLDDYSDLLGNEQSQQNQTEKNQKRASHKKVKAPQPPVQSAEDSIDFTPVYRCLHVFTCLGSRDQFDKYYQEQRQKQSKLAFNPPSNMSQSISSYRDYFSSVVGFFVIEDRLMGTTSGLIKQKYIDDLWNDAVQSMTTTLSEHYKLCTDATLMLKIKRLMMLFIYTVRNYGHNTDPLTNILIDIRDHYNEILKKQWQTIFEDIFKSDNYHPLEANNNEQYLQAVGNFNLYEIDGDSFPKKFPYSPLVPKVDNEVRKFIEQSLKFSQDLSNSQAEDIVRKSTYQLLNDILGGCLSTLIHNPSLKLLQLIQIIINTNFLEDSLKLFDEHITYQVNKYMGSGYDHETDHTQTTNQFRLQGKSMFKNARADAITQIHRKLEDQIDQFLSLATYDWTMTEATGQASSYISDLIAWLKSIFQAFTNLPQEIAQSACMSACKYIAQQLRNMILSDEIKSISIGGLEQFNLDLIQCEHFAGSEPVKGFKEGDLSMTFAELRQLCDLFLYSDYSTYISDMGKQQNKYLRVTTATALNVVEKIREHEGKKHVFGLMKNDRQKLLESFAKSLRQLQQQQQIQNQQYQYSKDKHLLQS